MPPKKKPFRRPGACASDDLFHYNNQVELTFKNQPKSDVLNKLRALEDSSSSEEEEVPFLKGKVECKIIDSSSSEAEEDSVAKRNSEEADKTEDKTNDENREALIERPVTPPPEVPTISTFSRRGLKLSKDVGLKLRSLQEVAQQCQSPDLSVQRTWSDVVVVDQDSSSPDERKFTVRIRTRTGVERFPISVNDKFEGIINELAKKQSVPVETISLSFTDSKGNFQLLKASDSPKLVNLSCADIIDCIIVSSAPADECIENEKNVVNIKIQGSEAKLTKLFKAFKDEALENIMKQYAEFCKLPISKLKFLFDGEIVSRDQTPDDLDMDDDNVIDVRVS